MCGGSPPKPPPPPPPPKIPQMPKVPEQDAFKRKNKADQVNGFSSGYSGTVLTGASGTQTSSNNLGGSSVLGK